MTDLRPEARKLLEQEASGDYEIVDGRLVRVRDEGFFGVDVRLASQEPFVCGYCAYDGISDDGRCPNCGTEL